MKFAAGIFTVLLFLNTILLYFQYDHYQKTYAKEVHDFSYQQEIEITLRNNTFFVKQQFKDLPDEQIDITWPLKSENRSCTIQSNDSCKRLSSDLTVLKKGTSSSESISYEIKLEKPLQSKELLKGLFAQLKEGTVSNTILHVTDEMKHGGLWLSGLPAIGRKQLTHIDYVLFSGKGEVFELYWQKEPYPAVVKSTNISLYTDEPLSADVKKSLTQLSVKDAIHQAVVVRPNEKIENGKRIIFLNDTQSAQIEKQLILNTVQTLYKVPQEEQLALQVTSSFIADKVIGDSKTKYIFDTLSSYMTAEQKKQWRSQLEHLKGKTLSANVLDKVLSKVLASKTSFIEMNVEASAVLYPLVFEDARPIFIDQLEQKEVKVIYSNGRVLYATEPLLKILGYANRVGEKGYYVQNPARAFRFPMDEPFYVFNERRYDAHSQPIEKIGDHYYIEESWFIRLFLVNIDKKEDKISISQQSLFNGGS